MNERRIKRLEAQIKGRAAEVVGHEMADPRRGLITITRVALDRELTQCKIYWSVLGDEKTRALNAGMLEHAARYVQREIGGILRTRTVPQVRFVFDESIEGSIRVQQIIDRLRDERDDEPDADDEPNREPDA
ncbi:MAG: 30S ribosome-binding factor RbfA [Planctomycetota bacterium]